MNEREIEQQIWNIIEREISKAFYSITEKAEPETIMKNIVAKVNKLLNDEQAIMVYKP